MVRFQGLFFPQAIGLELRFTPYTLSDWRWPLLMKVFCFADTILWQ
jgi:hypothetical protein